jgi:lipoate synthase
VEEEEEGFRVRRAMNSATICTVCPECKCPARNTVKSASQP